MTVTPTPVITAAPPQVTTAAVDTSPPKMRPPRKPRPAAPAATAATVPVGSMMLIGLPLTNRLTLGRHRLGLPFQGDRGGVRAELAVDLQRAHVHVLPHRAGRPGARRRLGDLADPLAARVAHVVGRLRRLARHDLGGRAAQLVE